MNIALMTPDLWQGLEFFKPENTSDNFGEPYLMDAGLMFGMDSLRKFVGKPINIHCGYEKRDKRSYHDYCDYCSLAVDFHIHSLNLLDQLLIALRFDVFNGIGIYPWWHSPGIHADRRPIKSKLYSNSFWISPDQGVYLPLNAENIRKYIL